MRNFSDEKKAEDKDASEEEASDLAAAIAMAMERPEIRFTGIYGDINEEKCSEVVYGLISLNGASPDPSDPAPIDFYISTYGGQATEMFSVYDVMRIIRQETPIHTCGIGKVMSAGVLLLAAGTKGERRIGKNCRVMIHGVVGGQHGHIADIENEFSETKLTQKMYVKALVEETDMTEKYIKKLMDRKTNVYIDAEEAVNLGIADIVV